MSPDALTAPPTTPMFIEDRSPPRSLHRAVMAAALIASAAVFAIPLAGAMLVGFLGGQWSLAVGWSVIVLLAFAGPAFVFAYASGLLALWYARAKGIDLRRASLRRCQLAGLAAATVATVAGILVSNEINVGWFLFTLPAGFIGGSAFYRLARAPRTVLIAVLMLIASRASAQASLTGTVVDERTKQPLACADVALVDTAGRAIRESVIEVQATHAAFMTSTR